MPISLEENVVRLHELLYPGEAYEPSEALKGYSKIIEEDTKDYLIY